ncbi:MAG: hypothetical protein SEPTF4163_001673 [Sporothrix epigloea]
MGGDSRKQKPVTSLPLPAPTESESIIDTPTDAATDVSHPSDEKSSYSLPEDGTPVTIKTRGHSANRSQTSLLIEYFEGGKSPGSESSGTRRPSVRVRLKPSSSRKDERIMISKPKSSSHGRKTSLNRRSTTPQRGSASATRDLEPTGSAISALSALSGDGEDNCSIISYASVTDESNVSRNPIVVEIDRGGISATSQQRQRPRRTTSPLIPAAASSRGSASYLHGATSEMSAIPADSFLDGSKSLRSSSPTRDMAAAAAATAAGAAGAAAVERHRVSSRSRGESTSRDKTRDRDRDDRERDRSGRKHRSSRSRTSSHAGEREETASSSQRRSTGHRHENESISGAESSILSSAFSPSRRSHDQYSIRSGASKASSINNPKLLETVEDAIRRLILPELNALRRENSSRDRRGSTTSTGTSVSRDDYAGSDSRRFGASDRQGLSSFTPRDREAISQRESRDREGRHTLIDSPPLAVNSGEEADRASRAVDDASKYGVDEVRDAAIAAAADAALATSDHNGSPTTARDQRRRLRAEAQGKASKTLPPAQLQQGPPDLYLTGAHSAASRSFEGPGLQSRVQEGTGFEGSLNTGRLQYLESDVGSLQPPMPLMSEINSELTRTSILSADTDGPLSPSEAAQTPIVREVTRRTLSGTQERSPSPSYISPSANLQGLGTQHANISHGDLRALPRKAGSYQSMDHDGQHEEENDMMDREHQHSEQFPHHDEENEYIDNDDGVIDYVGQTYDVYGHQIVPAPLKYVPYQPEHRGLSPIPSVSGYTEGGNSEVQGYRDSGVTATSTPSPEKSSRLESRSVASLNSIPSNIMGREFERDDLSIRSSEIDYHPAPTQLTDLTEDGSHNNFRAVDSVAANPGIVHTPVGIESAVASLVDGSLIDGSVLTGNSSVNDGTIPAQAARGSMETLEEEQSRGDTTPKKRSAEGHNQTVHDDITVFPSHAEQHNTREIAAASPMTERSISSDFSGEYEIDQYGRKVRRGSPTASEAAAITAGAVGLAIRAARDRNQQPHQVHDAYTEHATDNGRTPLDDEWIPAGVQRNKSFKERTLDGRHPANTPIHSTDRLDEYDQPNFQDSKRNSGYDYSEDDNDPNSPFNHGRSTIYDDDEAWRAGNRTPTQQHHDDEATAHALKLAGAAAAAITGAMLAENKTGTPQHSRQTSQDRDEEWQRSSDDRKRDTLITNPYEGTSPIVNENLLKKSIPLSANGAAAAAAAAAAAIAYGTSRPDYTRSPLGGRYDEGYISQGPGKSPDPVNSPKNKTINLSNTPGDFGGNPQDPFYMANQTRNFSGLSQGMGSPLYDPATGAGIDRIENKDIVALMQHLMVRDAQRTARDTEILVTLVRAASDMRTSFESVRTMLATHEKGINNEFSKKLADSEDAIITEILEGTEKTVRTHLGGPRPLHSSGARPIHASFSQADIEDLPSKRQNIFRRALKSLNTKGNNDLTRIEDMLNELLTQVDVLKAQSAAGVGPGGVSTSGSAGGIGPSPYGGMLDGQMAYDQDAGYEPEGRAGTSTTSRASQSGLLTVNSRGGQAQSTKSAGYERKFSDNRISTVLEGNEDEMDNSRDQGAARGDSGDVRFSSPASNARMSTGRLAASPFRQQAQGMQQHYDSVQQSVTQSEPQNQQFQQGSQSNENTPKTEKAKKHKSNGSSSWFPKISRWSETTTSSVGRVFRASRDSKKDADDLGFYSGPSRSRSGSDLAAFDQYKPSSGDKLHTGFSDTSIGQAANQQHLRPDQQISRDFQYEDDIHGHHLPRDSTEILPPHPKTYMTPEDPKYRAHRDSLNLQHPQPRSGQPFKAALESQAADFDSPVSPHSADWAGSATSLNRFPGQNPNRFSDQSASNAASGNAIAQVSQQQYWDGGASIGTRSQSGPPRLPKEPVSQVQQQPRQQQTPPRTARSTEAAKMSPLQYNSTESGYGAATHIPTGYNGSPRLENRNLGGALTVPARRPSGPRAMTPKSERSVRSNAQYADYTADDSPRDPRRAKRSTWYYPKTSS